MPFIWPTFDMCGRYYRKSDKQKILAAAEQMLDAERQALKDAVATQEVCSAGCSGIHQNDEPDSGN